jgi:hypothetical protein
MVPWAIADTSVFSMFYVVFYNKDSDKAMLFCTQGVNLALKFD